MILSAKEIAMEFIDEANEFWCLMLVHDMCPWFKAIMYPLLIILTASSSVLLLFVIVISPFMSLILMPSIAIEWIWDKYLRQLFFKGEVK